MASHIDIFESNWWDSLSHGGLLIAPSRLQELGELDFPRLSGPYLESLRSLIARTEGGDNQVSARILDLILEELLRSREFGRWLTSSELTQDWSVRSITGQSIRPRRVWTSNSGTVSFPVFVDTDVARIGVGKGVNFHARAVEWLRKKKAPIGLLFNGRSLRLVHAGVDYDAWAEWQLGSWFFAGEPGSQIEALQRVLDFSNICNETGSEQSRVVRLIKDSRKGQAELSKTLGEQVRGAVEILIRDFREIADDKVLKDNNVDRQALYIASTRIVMRLITTLFAESRDLLPLGSPVYYDSYSLRGLRELLTRRSRGGVGHLKDTHFTWPRLQALFKLLYFGSVHPELNTPKYYGDLYRPGAFDSNDMNSRALAIFEDSEQGPSDAAIFEILRLLTSVKTSVKQKGGRKHVQIPIDFSDLSSEYIGILYEGLLDYELQRAPEDSPVIFLNIGNQPGLPLKRLEAMSDDSLKELFKNLKKKEADGSEEEDVESEEPADEVEEQQDAEELSEIDSDDIRGKALEAAMSFTKRAAIAAGLVKSSKNKKQDDQDRLEKAARGLISKQPILPNEWYLIRWGGTRKGGGTYYTRPQLAVPTVRRTLEPLCFDEINGVKVVKTPEAILDLKVCDPAMGSGSFLVGTTRYLTEILKESLYTHGRIKAKGNVTEVTLVKTTKESESIIEQFNFSSDDPKFESNLVGHLKRRVVENCIYGVDIDAMAVELAKLALWIETMDKDLPFEFLDHRLKCGNALVGCNLIDFIHYPIQAWSRDMGDEKHKNGIHYGEKEFTNKKKNILDSKVKPELDRWISELRQSSNYMEETEDLKKSVQQVFNVYRRLARLGLKDTEKKREIYEAIQADATFIRLKQIFNAWCAIWFFDPFDIEKIPTPATWPPSNPETLKIIDNISSQRLTKFFHWELEFPDVFANTGGSARRGFDAILGNPPWDTLKPNSKEFFSNIDPLYRGYSKKDALAQQTLLFEERIHEKNWISYNAAFSAFNNWFSFVATPTGFGVGQRLLDGGRFKNSLQLWDQIYEKDLVRKLFKPTFVSQGDGEFYTYRLFLEHGWNLLKNDGLIGFIVPSGLYSDLGSTAIRRVFLDQGRLMWVFGFVNTEQIFSIHLSYKFCCLIAQKGGITEEVKTAFLVKDLDRWLNPDESFSVLQRTILKSLSPENDIFFEFTEVSQIEVFQRFLGHSKTFGYESGCNYSTNFDFHLSNQPEMLMAPDIADPIRKQIDRKGCVVENNMTTLLPLFQGAMVDMFNPNASSYGGGRGNKTKWHENPPSAVSIVPQFFIKSENFRMGRSGIEGLSVVFRYLVNPTNARTMISSMIPDFPVGNTLVRVQFNDAKLSFEKIGLVAIFNSFVFDWMLRIRFGGAGGVGALNPGYLKDLPIPKLSTEDWRALAIDSLRLCRVQDFSEDLTVRIIEELRVDREHFRPFRSEAERARAIIRMEFLILSNTGLTEVHVDQIFSECMFSPEELKQKSVRKKLNPKGFWRLDKEKNADERITNRIRKYFYAKRNHQFSDFIAEIEEEYSSKLENGV